MKKSWQFMIGFAVLLCIYTGLHFVPSRVENYSLIYEKLMDGEVWRVITYQFVHLNEIHLFENFVSLFFVMLIAIELHMDFKNVSSMYLSAGFLAIMPVWFFARSTVIGASVALYSGYGMGIIDIKKLGLNTQMVIGAVLFLVFIRPLYFYLTKNPNFTSSIISALYHTSGLSFGLIGYTYLTKIKKRRFLCLRSLE